MKSFNTRLFRTISPYTLAILLLLLLTFFLYTPGLTSGFFYDDAPHLAPLSSITSTQDLLAFIFASDAGPLGRPIAMASFLLETGSWPDNPQPFLVTNILIHLINTLLVYTLCLRISAFSIPDQRDRYFFSFSATAIWALLPILASSNLLVIQRMTTLAASFVLAGLIMYLYVRQHEPQNTRRALTLQAFIIIGFTGLATLTKENGALLPIYILCLEAILLKGANSNNRTQRIRNFSLWSYLALVIGYLIYRAHNSGHVYAYRHFDLFERLITQPKIIAEYTYLAFIPRSIEIHPFHDHYEKLTSLLSPDYAIIYIAAHLIILLASWRLLKTYPLISFSIIFYYAGNLLESTSLPLELYFQHRIYLPILGPTILIAYLISRYRAKTISTALLLLYLTINSYVLHQVTSLWGNKLLAAELWHKENPTSVRAAQYPAILYTDEHGSALPAIRVLDETSAACPDCSAPALQALMLSCPNTPREDMAKRLADIKIRVPHSRDQVSVADTLYNIYTLSARGHCPGISIQELLDLNLALLREPYFIYSSTARPGIYRNLYFIYQHLGDIESSRHQLLKSWNENPDLETLERLVLIQKDLNMHNENMSLLELAQTKLPANPFNKIIWEDKIVELRKTVLDSPSLQNHTNPPHTIP